VLASGVYKLINDRKVPFYFLHSEFGLKFSLNLLLLDSYHVLNKVAQISTGFHHYKRCCDVTDKAIVHHISRSDCGMYQIRAWCYL
jgi:hypothetical protein